LFVERRPGVSRLVVKSLSQADSVNL